MSILERLAPLAIPRAAMKDLTASTCDHRECECLATIDMVVIAPTNIERQIARVSIFLYLCEAHARTADWPSAVMELEEKDLISEALEAAGYGRPDFSRSFWEFSPIPVDVAVRLN